MGDQAGALAAAVEAARGEASSVTAALQTQLDDLTRAHMAALKESEARFEADQDELLKANEELSAQLEQALAETAGAKRQLEGAHMIAPCSPAATPPSPGSNDEQLLAVQGELLAAQSERDTKEAELLRCQEMLAMAKSELLNLQLAQEEMATASSSSAALPQRSSSFKPGNAGDKLKGLFKKK